VLERFQQPKAVRSNLRSEYKEISFSVDWIAKAFELHRLKKLPIRGDGKV
jgi:hypothetical protein